LFCVLTGIESAYFVCRLLCTDPEVLTGRGECWWEGRESEGHDHETQTLGLQQTICLLFFACFFRRIACLELGTSTIVVRGMKLVPLRCESVGGRRKAGCRLRRDARS